MTTPTLRSQLTRTFMLTALVALALNACLILAYEFNRYRIEAAEELHTQEIILAKALVPSLVFNDPDAAAQQLSSLAERHDILEAEVFSANGRRSRAITPMHRTTRRCRRRTRCPRWAAAFRATTSNSPTTSITMANAWARCIWALTTTC